MKVAILVNFDKRLGGTIFTNQLANFFRKNNISVNFLSRLPPKNDFLSRVRDKNPKTIKYFYRQLNLIKPDCILLFGDIDLSIITAIKLLKIPLIIAVQIPYYLNPLSYANDFFLEKKLEGSSLLVPFMKRFSCFYTLMKRIEVINEYADYIIVCSKFLRDYLKKFYKTKIEVIYNGVPRNYLEKSLPPKKSKEILFLGNKRILKGYLEFLKLKKRLNEFSFIPNSCRFLPHSKVSYFYKKAFLTFFPSVWEESFGLVIIESMSKGTPVIAYDSGAVKEIISHGKDSFIVPKFHIGEVIEIIKELYNNPEKYEKIRRNGVKKVKRMFLLEKNGKKYIEIIKKV
jgi:glycosyltransferase involved in cell wall biosynthesis